ncbi:MAG: hypothetical protein JNL51_16120 [Chitinophagaceae bacterium]|nr:hypothetical protein [Chitinophagaceae bacterium]
MKLIKLGLLSVFFLSLILFLMSLLIPPVVRVSRAIDIHAPIDAIQPRLADLQEWKDWNEMAKDEMEIKILSVSRDTITVSWKNGNRPVLSAFTLAQSGETTVVQWYFDFRLNWYPWEKFGSIVFDKHFGTPMEKSLNNLKKKIEGSR